MENDSDEVLRKSATSWLNTWFKKGNVLSLYPHPHSSTNEIIPDQQRPVEPLLVFYFAKHPKAVTLKEFDF